jgi:hypothetical protein
MATLVSNCWILTDISDEVTASITKSMIIAPMMDVVSSSETSSNTGEENYLMSQMQTVLDRGTIWLRTNYSFFGGRIM